MKVKVLKTPVAFDEHGNPYRADQIDALYDRLVDMKLRSLSLAPVRPQKTGKKQAHFKMKAKHDVGTGLEHTERTPTHNETVEILLNALKNADPSIVFKQNVFKAPASKFFTLPKGTRYRWVCEPETRYWVDDRRFIQPDILGWDESRFSPGPRNPTIIIEVVYTHFPEFDTWLVLESLSKRNHIVLFYFVRPGRRMNFLNSINAASSRPPLEMNVEYVLREGRLFEGSKDVTPSLLKSDQDRYDEIFNVRMPDKMAKLKKKR